MAEDRPKIPFHEQVAAEMIAALENGTAPWIKPWEPGAPAPGPENALTGRPYRGINRLRLGMLQMAHGSADPRWCTYKQAQDLGAQVRRGARGILVQHWKQEDRKLLRDGQGKPVLDAEGQRRYVVEKLARPQIFHAVVFHASQIENLPPLPPKPELKPEAAFERHERSEKLLQSSGAAIFHDQANRAFYRPSTDEIHLPKREQFHSPDGYYATALHELGHWTGHESRLNRELQRHPFGSGEYAREELRAEIASYMLGMELGIGHDPGQHQAYVAGWIEALKKDPKEIIRAARDADQIKEYVLGLEREREQEQEATPGREQGADRGDERYSATSVKPWPGDFPVVYTHTSISAMKGSYKGADAARDAADYEAAKRHGDIEAARRLVARRINPEHLQSMVDNLKERGIKPEEVIVVPVLEKEHGRNVIPRVLGEYIADKLNMRFEHRIVDASQTTHTGRETINRLLDRKFFEGPVEKGGKYLMVDDVLTQGGTLHELRHYLANNGGEAAAALTLAFSRNSSIMKHRNTLAIQSDTIKELEERHGRHELEEVLTDHNISGSIDALTEGEGRFLLGASFKSVRDIDNAINKAIAGRQSRTAAMAARTSEVAAGSEPDVAGGTGGIQGVERGTGQIDVAEQAAPYDVRNPEAERAGRYQTLTALFGEDALFSEIEEDRPAVIPLASPVAGHDLAAVFPGADITDLPDGSGYNVAIGKVSFSLRTVERITPDTHTFALAYGREFGADEQIRGAVRNGEILIAHIGDRNTIRHESYHLLEDLGLVTQKERDILTRAARDAVRAGNIPGLTLQADPEEQRAYYVEQQLARREYDRNTPAGRVLQKVGDFVDSLANLALRTERGILRDIEAGKFFETREPSVHNPQATHYAAAPEPAREKTYLQVPYKEKEEAKKHGAKWDGRARSWFAPEGTDLTPLRQWMTTRERSTPPAVLDPRREFGDRLREIGLVIEGDPVMDGKIQRVPVVGGRPGAKDGAYCGYADGRPNGWMQNHKTGVRGKWLYSGHVPTSEARRDLRRESAAKLEAREEERKEIQDKAMRRAYAVWMNAGPADPEHPYLREKGVEAHGLRQDRNGNLLVPGFDPETGRLKTLERISPEGKKWYERDCPKQGAVGVIPDKDALKTGEVVLMVEGYATGASVHQATGLPVAVAFDAGNIKDAALAIKRKMPNVKLTICADNDAPRISDAKNIGVVKAKEAAAAIPGCKVVVADFSKSEKERGLTDFNDLHRARGLDAVRGAVLGRSQERESGELER